MQHRTWTMVGSLTGLVVCAVLVAVAPVFVRDLRGTTFEDLAVPALLVSGAVGVVLGGFVASHVARTTPRRMAVLGAVCGAILGAAAMGSLFLAVEVAGDDWPHGLSAFVTGGIFGAVVGGFLGGVIGFVQANPRIESQGHVLGDGVSAANAASRRDVR